MNRACLIILASFFLYGVASAHDYWIIPEDFQPAESTLLNATFGCGHTYFMSEEVPDITKFAIMMHTPGGREFPLALSRVNHKAATIPVPILGKGTYVISASSIMPSYWTSTRKGWVPLPKTSVKNVIKGGKYFKSIKTFLTAVSPSDSFKKNFGYRIELIPQKNPTALKPGEELPLVALYNGKPLAGATLFGLFEGFNSKEHETFPIDKQTDEQGKATVKLDKPGTWLIGVKYQFNTPNDPEADYENNRAYIMFNIEDTAR